MIDGRIKGGKNMTVLDNRMQHGKGEQLQIVSPSQQTVNMAKALITKESKRKIKRQSTFKRGKRRTLKKSKKTKKKKTVKKRVTRYKR